MLSMIPLTNRLRDRPPLHRRTMHSLKAIHAMQQMKMVLRPNLRRALIHLRVRGQEFSVSGVGVEAQRAVLLRLLPVPLVDLLEEALGALPGEVYDVEFAAEGCCFFGGRAAGVLVQGDGFAAVEEDGEGECDE